MATVYDNVVSFCVVLSPFCVDVTSICIIDVASICIIDVAAICIIDVAAVPGVIWLLFVWCCRPCVLTWLLSECIGFCLCGNVAFLCVELSPLCVNVINA